MRDIRVGDLVRVRQFGGGLGPSRYEVTKIGPRFACKIRQWPGPMRGGSYAEQDFDLSMLQVDNSGPRLLARLLPRVG